MTNFITYEKEDLEYLKKNDVMRKAWEDAGWNIEN